MITTTNGDKIRGMTDEAVDILWKRLETYKCSLCDAKVVYAAPNYCPICGAKMEVDET